VLYIARKKLDRKHAIENDKDVKQTLKGSTGSWGMQSSRARTLSDCFSKISRRVKETFSHCEGDDRCARGHFAEKTSYLTRPNGSPWTQKNLISLCEACSLGVVDDTKTENDPTRRLLVHGAGSDVRAANSRADVF
jgi:hypothetical protein